MGGAETYMPVCRECFLFQTQEQERRQAAAQAETTQVVLRSEAEEEKVDDDDCKLIVTTQKSQGSVSTQTNSGEKLQQKQPPVAILN